MMICCAVVWNTIHFLYCTVLYGGGMLFDCNAVPRYALRSVKQSQDFERALCLFYMWTYRREGCNFHTAYPASCGSQSVLFASFKVLDCDSFPLVEQKHFRPPEKQPCVYNTDVSVPRCEEDVLPLTLFCRVALCCIARLCLPACSLIAAWIRLCLWHSSAVSMMYQSGYNDTILYVLLSEDCTM